MFDLDRVRVACERDVEAMPGGRPRSPEELARVLFLSSMNVTAAKVQILKLGLGRFSFSDERRRQLAHYVLEPVNGILATRIEEMWSGIEEQDRIFDDEARQAGVEIEDLLPNGLQLDLHQLQAISFARSRGFRTMFNDDMGLGKTVEAMGCLLLAGSDSLPALVVCPKSMLGTWGYEAERWLSELEARAWMVEKELPSAVRNLEARTPAVVAVTWPWVATHANALAGVPFGTLIVDEAQFLGSVASQRTRGVFRLRAKIPRRLLLTGTPMPNGRPIQMFAQFKIVDKDSVPGEKEYGHRYCGPRKQFLGSRTVRDKKTGKKKRVARSTWKFDGRSNEVEFAELLSRYQIRRTKKEVGLDNLPDKTRYSLRIILTDAEHLRLQCLKDEVKASINRRAKELEGELLSQGQDWDDVQARVQAVLGAETVTACSRLRMEVGRIKALRIESIARELYNEGERVVVFAFHRDVAAIAVKTLSKIAGEGEVMLGTGKTPSHRRQEIIEDWQTGKGRFLVLTRAFHAGVTLTSAAHMVFIERFWVPGEEEQAEDRIHRRGQERKVAYWYMVCPGTVDDAVGELVTWKERGNRDVEGSLAIRVLQWVLDK